MHCVLAAALSPMQWEFIVTKVFGVDFPRIVAPVAACMQGPTLA
jgi:hypothetical protein